MSNLFKKSCLFGDLHLGLKSNSSVHLNDCWNYIQWLTETAKKEGCDTCFFLGDFHNNRASINIVTLNYSIKCLEHLSKNFERVFFIPGNHDLFYRDKRDVQSAEWAKHIPNIIIVNDFFQDENVSIVPWLVKDEHSRLRKIKADYMFGHFELPHFYMNAMVQMPDHGEIQREHLEHIGHVFSGHFHKRQTNKNISYIGNCFPHSYADAGDDARGCVTLEWGSAPVYHTWAEQPRYRVHKLSDVLTDPEKILLPGMHTRVNLDIDISYEEANFIKETFVTTYNLREIALIPAKTSDVSQYDNVGQIQFESVDQIVSASINGLDTSTYDPKMLLEIYRSI